MTERRYTASEQPENTTNNRGNDVRIDDTDTAPVTLSVMTVDEIIINYFNDVIKPSITEVDNLVRVPVIYGGAERWAMFRKDGVLRAPNTDKALTPMIMIRRKTVERGVLTNPSNKYLQTSWETGWNSRNAYDKFSILNNIRPSRQFRSVIIPDYVDITYDVVLWTEYEEQMSQLIGQIQVENDEYWGNRNNFKFRVKIDSMDTQTEIEAAQDRVVRTAFTIKVSAYLIPERMIQDAKIVSTNQKYYTAKKIVSMVEIDNTK